MIISYPTVEVKHIWQVCVTSELKIKLFCFFTIPTMIWIFMTEIQIFKSFGCTKVRKGWKLTKTSSEKVMQPTTSNNDPRPIFPDHVHNQSDFEILTMHNTVMLIKFSKQIANSFAKIINDYKGEFKTLSNIWDRAFSAKLLLVSSANSESYQTPKMEFFAKIVKN